MYYSHILNFNIDEWVPVKGRIVVPNNSVSTSNWYRSSIKAYYRNYANNGGRI